MPPIDIGQIVQFFITYGPAIAAIAVPLLKQALEHIPADPQWAALKALVLVAIAVLSAVPPAHG